MAEHASDTTHGHMDIHQQEASFHTFILLAKWGSLAVAVAVLLFTMWFCTSAGFLGAIVPALVVAALGVFLLREKPGGH